MGVFTLSADDILEHNFSMEPGPFKIVLYAEKERGFGKNRAIIYSGNRALKPLKKLMKKGHEF